MEDRDLWSYYQTQDLAVVPYMPGTPVYRDGLLPHLYEMTKMEDKIELVFCGDVLNMDSFVDFFVKRKTMQVLCRISEEEKLKPCGYAWIDSPVGEDGARSALCGFCFFDEVSATHDARDLARLGIAYWFEALRIDVVHGIMLAPNTAAKNFALNLGFKEVAVVPKRHFYKGELVGARVMMLQKSEFMPEFDLWFESKKAVAATV